MGFKVPHFAKHVRTSLRYRAVADMGKFQGTRNIPLPPHGKKRRENLKKRKETLLQIGTPCLKSPLQRFTPIVIKVFFPVKIHFAPIQTVNNSRPLSDIRSLLILFFEGKKKKQMGRFGQMHVKMPKISIGSTVLLGGGSKQQDRLCQLQRKKTNKIIERMAFWPFKGVL